MFPVLMNTAPIPLFHCLDIFKDVFMIGMGGMRAVMLCLWGLEFTAAARRWWAHCYFMARIIATCLFQAEGSGFGGGKPRTFGRGWLARSGLEGQGRVWASHLESSLGLRTIPSILIITLHF